MFAPLDDALVYSEERAPALLALDLALDALGNLTKENRESLRCVTSAA